MGTVGDVELSDEAGRVYGAFLNEWKASGSKDRERVGCLDYLRFRVVRGVERDERLIDEWVVTLLALVQKCILSGKIRYGELAGEVAAGAVALCVVS